MNEIKVLNHGFVRLIDVMGNDSSIVQAARVSYGEGTKSVSDDEKLIRYLMKNAHTSPFEMVEFKFHIKLPIFVARQWVRHRTANINEYSGRYSVMKPDFYIPKVLYRQHVKNKQASSDEPIERSNELISSILSHCNKSYSLYEGLLSSGVSRELARIILPLNLYTEWYWKIDLHNLLHFLKLRLDKKAQGEIVEYARVIEALIEPIVPLTYKAFKEFVLSEV